MTIADLGHRRDVLRRAQPQQQDRSGVVLVAPAPVPVQRHDRPGDLGRRARGALSGRCTLAQVGDPRPPADPGRLRRGDHRADHARASPARPTSSGTAPTASRSASTRSTHRRTSGCSSAACSWSSTGIRSMWAKQDIELDFKGFLPVLVSTILFIGVAGFITMYLSAFMTNVTPTSDFVARLPDAFQGRLHRPVDQPQRRADRLRRQPVAVLLLLGQPRHGGDDRDDARCCSARSC